MRKVITTVVEAGEETMMILMMALVLQALPDLAPQPMKADHLPLNRGIKGINSKSLNIKNQENLEAIPARVPFTGVFLIFALTAAALEQALDLEAKNSNGTIQLILALGLTGYRHFRQSWHKHRQTAQCLAPLLNADL